MNVMKLVQHHNPITSDAIQAWELERQFAVRHRVLEGLDDTIIVGPMTPPARSRRPLALAAVAGLIIGAVLFALRPDGPEQVEIRSAPPAVEELESIEELEPIELSTGDYIWLSPEVPSPAEAALAFLDQAIGWRNPNATIRSNTHESADPSPTWVDLTYDDKTITMLLVPDGIDAARWILQQVGIPGATLRVQDFPNLTKIMFGTLPPGTDSVTVLVGSDSGTTRTTITDVDNTSGVTVEGSFHSSVMFYFDADGALIDARGGYGYGGPPETNR